MGGRSRSMGSRGDLGATLLDDDEHEEEHHHDNDLATKELRHPSLKTSLDPARLSAELSAPHLHKEMSHDRETQKHATRNKWRSAAIKLRALSIFGSARK